MRLPAVQIPVGPVDLDHVTQGRRQLARAVIASTIGTTIEWYDFFLYSSVTALVFARLYFPNSEARSAPCRRSGYSRSVSWRGPLERRLRPLRRSRRPQVDADRDAAADGLVHFRGGAGADLRQDRHLGRGAADGAALPRRGRRRRVGRVGALAMEWAKTSERRGFIASWPQVGVPTGLFLANRRCSDSAPCPAMRFWNGAADPVPAEHRAHVHRPLRPPAHR